MLLILASRWDTTAQDIAAAWSDQPVRVMTARDLSHAGWCQSLGTRDATVRDGAVRDDPAVHRGRAVIAGQPIADEEIHGVLTRLPWVTDTELPEVVAPDRSYIAAEMSAFLLCWLADLACPVLNKPTPTCLSGPGWRAERWALAAAATGMTVRAVRRDTRSSEAPVDIAGSTYVTVVGSQVLGEVAADLAHRARHLAELAGVSLLALRFSSNERGAEFLGADVFPSLDDEVVRRAVLAHLAAGPGM